MSIMCALLGCSPRRLWRSSVDRPILSTNTTDTAVSASGDKSPIGKKTTGVAEKVISSSLHPLVIASSTGLPLMTSHLIISYMDDVEEWEKHPFLLAENTQVEPRPFIIPPRWYCNFGGIDDEYTKWRVKRIIFTDEGIIEVHP